MLRAFDARQLTVLWSRNRASIPVVLISLTVGTLLVAVGYAGGRLHDSWGGVSFWTGSILSFFVLAGAVTSTTLSFGERLSVVILEALQQSFVRWMYSPLSFTFPDELQHWRTAIDILTFDHLYHVNPTLPVSPVFPGLENMATALVQVTHAGLFPAGLVIAAAAHVMLAGTMLYLFRRVLDDDRLAAVAAFVFALNPLHAGFDTMFIYEGPALMFGAVVLTFAVDDRRLSKGELAIALVSLAALVVTHHLTAAFMLGALGVVGLGIGILGHFQRTARRTLALFVAGVAMASAWVDTEARAVVGYLGDPLESAISGVVHFGGQGTVALPTAKQGSSGGWFTVVGTVITIALIVLAVWLIWRQRMSHDRSATLKVFLLCALVYFAVLGVREFAPDGAELAGRLLTFAAFFTAAAVAFALGSSASPLLKRRNWARPIAIIAMLGIFLGGTMSGWPAPWEILPGKFHVAGFESGIDRQNLTAARWFRAHVGPNRRVACDIAMCTLLGAYAEAQPIQDAGQIYYATRMSRSVLSTIHHRAIAYIVIDDRMDRADPITGHFFHVSLSQEGDQSTRVTRRAIEKFRSAPGIRLIYNSGTVQIYDLRGLPYD